MKKLMAIILCLIFTLGICSQAFAAVQDVHIFYKKIDLENRGRYELIKWRGKWHQGNLWEIRAPWGKRQIQETPGNRDMLLRLQDKFVELDNAVGDLKSIAIGESAVFIGVGISILSGGTLMAAGSVLIGAGITAGGTEYAVFRRIENSVNQIKDTLSYL